MCVCKSNPIHRQQATPPLLHATPTLCHATPPRADARNIKTKLPLVRCNRSHEHSIILIFAVEYLKIHKCYELMNLSSLYNHKVVIYIYS